MCPGLLFHFSTWTSGNDRAGCLQSCLEAGCDSFGLGPFILRWATSSLASMVCCVPQATAQLLDGEVENLLIL